MLLHHFASIPLILSHDMNKIDKLEGLKESAHSFSLIIISVSPRFLTSANPFIHEMTEWESPTSLNVEPSNSKASAIRR